MAVPRCVTLPAHHFLLATTTYRRLKYRQNLGGLLDTGLRLILRCVLRLFSLLLVANESRCLQERVSTMHCGRGLQTWRSIIAWLMKQMCISSRMVCHISLSTLFALTMDASVRSNVQAGVSEPCMGFEISGGCEDKNGDSGMFSTMQLPNIILSTIIVLGVQGRI